MLTIRAKRWFDRKWGNTYHSVQVFDDAKLIGAVPFAYGYGEGYLQTAHEILQAAGYYPKTGERMESGADKDYYEFMMDRREHRDRFLVFVDDVARRKDL